MKRITIIGIGMAGGKTVTKEALERIEEADILIGAERMIESCTEFGKPYYIAYKSNEIADYINSGEEENICVLVSGDVGFYSGTKKLIPLLKEYEVELIPGISSMSYFCAKLKMPWEHVYAISMHGRTVNIVSAVANHEKTFVLTSGNISEICTRLLEANLGYVEVYVGEQLAYEKERIVHGIPAELIDMEFDSLSVMLIVNNQHGNRAMTGIADEEFIRGNAPMTTSDVRALIISKLRLKSDGIGFDIGAATGSVSIEMALNMPNGKVYSIEFKEEAIRLIEANKATFYTENITVVPGVAPEALEQLPHPDSVFVGGSTGKMEEIISFLKETTVKPVRIVISAIALETVSEVLKLVQTYEISDVEMVQVAVSKASVDGSYHMMEAQNPIYLLSGYLNA